MSTQVQVLKLLDSNKQNLSYLNLHYEEFLERYNEKFIAIDNQKVVAEGRLFNDVLSKLRKKGLNPSNTLVRFISRVKDIL